MKRYSIYILLIVTVLITSCREDKAYDSAYISPIELKLSYRMFGDTKPYSSPLKMILTNNTEQITYQRESDLWGQFVLTELLPGEYTINVTGKLTAEEVTEATGETASNDANLVGFISNVKLKQTADVSLDKIKLILPPPSTLILKELYYAGSHTPSGGNYRNDNFYSIYNNTATPISLNDIYISSIESYGGFNVAGPLWPGEVVGEYKNIYAQAVWKVIADDAIPVFIQPGQTVIIAGMAAPHNKEEQYNLNSPVDLSIADYEAYSPDPSNKFADFAAPNMLRSFWPDYVDLWRISVFGQGIALIQASKSEFSQFETVTLPESLQDPFESEEYWLCKKIPTEYVIDAVDLIQNKTTTITKRFPPVLDSGFATVASTYGGVSVVRKVLSTEGNRIIYQDTNNSTEDFEVNDKPLSK